MEKIKLNTIEEAIEDFRKGEFVIIVDDEAVSYTHLTLPTNHDMCRSRWSPYH